MVLADEAESRGLVNRVFESSEVLEREVKQIAQGIAQKSPLTQRGVKQVMTMGAVEPWLKGSSMSLIGTRRLCSQATRKRRSPR